MAILDEPNSKRTCKKTAILQNYEKRINNATFELIINTPTSKP